MNSAADIAREMDEGLEQLFRAGLELALQVQADAMTAEAPRERAELASAFHRLSRSVRQTAALRIRLAGNRERAGREAADHAAHADGGRRRRRKAQVTQAVLAWAEHEKPDFDLELLQERIETVLDTEALYEDFLTDDLDAQVARIARIFGISVPPAPLDGPLDMSPVVAAPSPFDAAPPYPPSG